MRLKQCIFALMAMLLCAFSANAQSDGVAKIGSTTYATFAEALTAANAMSGDVTVEVYDKVTLNTAFSGSYSSINFVGKDTDAEIYLDVQGYITATGKKVSFTDLKLSKSAGGYMTNAGFMNVAFGIYDVTEVAYTNCVFANGAYASSGNVTFNGCTFYRSHDKYGLWAYGNVDATVEGCTFADYRGIKMYAEGAAKTVDLTVKDTDFSAVNDKPAIVLTYGESVVLEGNTYSSTGTFELDLDGAPNGTAVTSDVAPTCKNDNGTCGVLVDGKIYTTVAQAAEVAAEGSNVTLLYSTNDAVEFAEGVNLTLANGVTADNVTVVTSGVAKIGETAYSTLEDAFKAATSGCTIDILSDVTVDSKWDCRYTGAKFTVPVTINGNGKTIKFTGSINDSNWNTVFRFGENATVNNLTVDISNATGAQRVISAQKSLNVDGLKIVGEARYGVIYGEGASAADLAATEIVVKNSTLDGTRRALSDNEGGKDVKSVVIEGNTFNANVYVSAFESIAFNNNTVTGETDLRSYAADNVLNVQAQGNTLATDKKNYILAKTIEAQTEFVTENPSLKVATKAELQAALAAAKDGDVITLTADIDYGTDQLAITKEITLDLGGKTLTTRNAWGGMSIKGNPTVKNGNIVHASNTAAIKVWNATAFEDLVIDVQGKGDANKTIGGIVLQSGSTTRVGSIKNVTIKGAALTNGIETYNCGDATENVIGSMENVTIDAQGTGLLISAPCGTATNCDIKGGANGIEIWIKGNYSASLDLVDSNVEGGVYAHDEFSSNPSIVNNGTLNFTADAATTGASAEDVTLEIARAEADNVKGVLNDVMENAQAKVNNVYYATLDAAIKAAKAGDNTIELLADCAENVTITQVNGTNIVINGNDKTYTGTITVKGDKVANTETLTFQNINFVPASGTYAITTVKGTYASDITVDGCTFKGNNDVYGIRVRHGYNYTVKNTTAEGMYTFFNASEALSGLTVENVTVKCANAAFAGAYGFGDASFKDVTVVSDNNGVKVNNPNGSALTFENCSITAKTPVTFIESAGYTPALTAEFNGTNTMVVSEGGTYWFNIVEADGVAATFKAIVNDAALDMSNTAFAASVGNVYYTNLTAAVNAAVDGDVVVVARDIELDAANCVTNSDGYSVFVNVAGKAITIDLNGKVITANLSADQFASAKSSLLMAVFSVDTDGNLTLNDGKGTGKVAVTANDASVYSLISNYDKTAKLTINGGSYELDKARATSSLIHSDPSEAVVVNGGNFYLGNVNTGANGSPWIFNVNGNNEGHVTVNGGTFNYDVNHQYWVFEVHVDKTLALKDNGNGTWTVVPAVAYVNEKNGNYTHEAGYATLAEAISAAQAGDVVKVFEGTYAVPAMKAGITIEGVGNVLFEGTLSGTLENLTLKNLHIKGGNAQRWAYAKGNLLFENVTFEATSVYALHFDGITEGTNLTYKNCTIIGWAALGGSPASCVFDGCTIKDNGAYGVIRTYFDTTIENCTFDVANANTTDVYEDGIHAVEGANVVVDNCTNVNGEMKDLVNVSGASVVSVDGVEIKNVAQVGETKYTDLQEAIKAAAPAGTVELLSDVTVDEWIMFSETLTIGNGDIITTQINGLTINGNGKTVTIKDIESAGNGARLFYDATNLNINGLTFNFVDNAANLGGIGLTAGTIKNVTFNGGGYAIFPGTGAVIIEGCTFKTNATSIYYEEERDNLVVTGNTFENPDNVNVILLRGNTTFTDNNVISGRTVNVVSGSPVVTGNNFNDVRFKVYNVATATIEENTINTLAFNDESVVNSTFDSNTLSAEAQAVLDAANFPAVGSNSFAYTKEENGYVRVWGEGGGNAKESYELKLYSGETLIATTKLNNVGNILNGDVYVTWNFYYPESTDEYWTTTWEEGHPNSAAQPTEVELYIDGTLVATTAAKMSGADDIAPVVWRNLGGVAIANLLGEGTAENPYLIETLKDLKFFRDDVNAGNTYAGKTVKVINNIDLNSEAWTPISTFNGVFDGNDKTISNLVVNGDGKSNQGFFGQTNNGEIKNLTINNATVKGRLNVGVVAGTPYTSKYTNIKVTGDVVVEGMAYVGGVGGKNAYANWTDVTVDVNAGSYVKATSTEDGTAYRTYVGGVVGFNGEGGHTFKNISSNIKVIGDVMDIGGIFGIAHYGNNFENVTFSGSVEAAEGAEEVGGIAGVWNNTAGYTVTFTNCAVADGATVMIGTEDVTEKCEIVGGAYKPSNNTAANSGSLIIDGKEAWIMVAKIGETKYATLEEAFAAAAEGETITLLADATPALTSQRAITKAAVIDLGGNTLTLTEDDLYFGTTTFKNGTIVVDPSVKPSTAVFWMFANQTLTFDAVKVVATGVTGTYLIGLDGNNSDLNLLNGSEILIENTTALDLDVICVNASTGNDIVVENSKVNVTNLDGRVFFRGNYTVKDSEVNLAGITKAGFRIEAGQTLSIEGTSIVTVEGEPRDGGIHITDATATYTKAETATVNATVNAPAPAYVAKIGDVEYTSLQEAIEAAQDGETVTLLADVETADGIVITDKNLVIDLNDKTYTTTEGASTNNRNFKIEGTSVVTIKNGTMVAAGDYSSGAYGTVRTEGSANVTLEGLKLYNYRGNGLNIKACTGTTVTVKDTEIYANYGGGIESAGGTIVVDNVTVEQKGMYTAPYNSMAISVNGGGKVTVNSGTYSTECITAEEANNQGTSHGPWVAGVLNSGGTLIINGGTFSNDNFGENSLATYARGAILADTKAKVEINGGKFNVLKNVIDIQNNLGDANNNPSVVLAGGTYNADPRISAQYGSNLITMADGCVALPDLNGNYVVGVKPTATVNNLGQMTIPAGEYTALSGGNGEDMPLSFVMQFLADQDAEDMATSPYADWYGDFVITFTGLENGSFTADGCYLAGHYGSFGWVKVPVDGMLIEEGARYPVMLGVGLGQKYDYICSSVEDFKCALYLTPEILAANPNIQVKLELGVVDNSKGSDAAANALVNNENVYSVTEYTYDAEDFVVDPNYIAELTIDDAAGENYTNDTEKRVGTLTYKRTLVNGKWNALYLPFEIELTDELLANYDFADYNQMISHDTDGDRVPDNFEMELFIYTSGTLDANYPYFVRPKNEEACSMNLVLTDAILYPANENSLVTSSVKNTFKLSGTYKAMGAEELAGKYAISIDGDWSYTSALKPYRLYLTITDNNGAVVASGASKSVRIVVRGEDGTTGVEEITGENGEDMIFDLQGRRVLEPEKGGLYIINGKKVMVK